MELFVSLECQDICQHKEMRTGATNSKAVGGTQPRGRFWGQSFLRWETAMFAYKFTGVFVIARTAAWCGEINPSMTIRSENECQLDY